MLGLDRWWMEEEGAERRGLVSQLKFIFNRIESFSEKTTKKDWNNNSRAGEPRKKRNYPEFVKNFCVIQLHYLIMFSVTITAESGKLYHKL